MKLVDVPDSKSGVVHPTCRFDSGLRHFLNTHLGCFLVCKQQTAPTGVEPPVLTSHKTILNRFARQSGLRHFLKAPFKVIFWYHFPRHLRERARVRGQILLIFNRPLRPESNLRFLLGFISPIWICMFI